MRKKFLNDTNNYGYFFIAPYLIVFVLLQLYPILYTLFLSFQKWDGMSDMRFIGLDNYIRLLKDDFFLTAFMNTWIIWLVNFIPQLVFAIALSVFLSSRRIVGRDFFRAIYYLPNLVTMASVGVLARILLDWQGGPINHLMLSLGVFREPVNFLASPFYTRLSVSVIQWWMWFGHTTIIMMAGLKTIPEDLYEAAVVDGASPWQQFVGITLPLLRHTLLYVGITSLIGGMQIFDVPNVLTNGLGAPDKSILTMVMYLYNQTFRNYNTGYGATVAYGLFLIILAFSIAAFNMINRKSATS